MTAYVPYQVDYKVENKAKSLGFSKKKVFFKFGIANNQALQQGLVGSNCRGSEHEVTFIWSLKSGKRQIIADNKEVHFSESGQNGWTGDRTFQHHFGVHSPGFGVIRCHLVTLPSDPNAPGGNRPFDLRIGGTSFFDFSKIFQLGTPAMIVRPVPVGGVVPYRNPSDETYASAEEREMIARAKLESLRDIRQSRPPEEGQQRLTPAPSHMPPKEESLISFEEPPLPPRGGPQQVSSVTLDPTFSRAQSASSYGSYGVLPPQQPQQAPPTYNNYQLPPAQPLTAPPPPAPYSNYQLPLSPAPAPVAHFAPAHGPQYAPLQTTHGQHPQPPPSQYPAAPPYGQPPSAYGFGQPAPYHNQRPPAMGFAQQSQGAPNIPGFASPKSTSPQSAVSYGSAPSFAQPPRPYGR